VKGPLGSAWLLVAWMAQAGALPTYLAQPPSSSLALRMEAGNLRFGLPESLTFVMTNQTDRTISMATPVVFCADPDYEGSIYLKTEFTPLNPNQGRREGDCTNDRMDRPSIAERIKLWKQIAPGESMRVTITRAEFQRHAHFLDSGPGTYVLSAIFEPPRISAAEAEVLRNLGLSFPAGSVTTAKTTFVKQP
jgi:hypothetical protein